MNKKITPYLFAVSAAGIAILLSATLSQIFLPAGEYSPAPRPQNQQEADAMAQALLESKCASCHGEKPEYNSVVNLLALGLLKRDVENAQRSFKLGRDDWRSGHVDYLRMDYVLRTRKMPPTQYSMVHLGTRLTPEDVDILRHRYSKAGAYLRAFSAIAPATVAPEDKEKVELGRLLFFDPRLSTNNQVACASCHDLTKGGTDNLPKSEGVPGPDGKPQLGGVNAPTVYNAAGNIRQFWDGRAADLQEQAGGPPLNPVEMGYSTPSDWQEIAAKLAKDERLSSLFARVYGEAAINGETITDAIAAFERTLTTPGSAFDRYLLGDKEAMTPEQVEGMEAFVNYGCATCHSGPALGGLSFEYINTHADLRRLAAPEYQEGAFGLKDFTKKEAHRDMFRVPTLRNVALTAPYFHTGTVNSLQEAVRIMFETEVGAVPGKGTVNAVTRFLEAQTGCLNGKPLDALKPEDVAPPANPVPQS